MTADIKTYLVMGLMQLQGHLNAGAGTDPDLDAMANSLLDETMGKELAADAAANANAVAAHFDPVSPNVGYECQELGIIADVALTANVNDYVIITFEVEDGAGGGKATLGTIYTNATNWAIGQKVTATLASNTTIPAGGVLSVKSVKTGAGVSQPARRAYARIRRSVA